MNPPAVSLVPYSLEVSFSLETATVIGRSRIELPAGIEATLYLTGLRINSLKINDTQVDSSGSDILSLLPEEAPRIITIDFSKKLPAAEAQSAEGRIAADGIALTGQWHPIIDQDCRLSLTARIPADFEAIAEADVITSEVQGLEKIVSFSLSQPMRSLTLIAGPYEIKKETFGNNKELFSYFFPEDRDLADHYRQKAAEYLTRYESLLGEYPYQRFSIVENRLPTGFAVPTFTLLGQAVIRLPFIVDTSLGHEILHAWLGNSVRTDLSEGNWAEGLTTYLADHAFAAEEGRGVDFRKEQLVTYQSHVLADNTLALKDFVGGVSHLEKNQEAARAIGYNKASMVFHMLRTALGDEIFFKGLRAFIAGKLFQKATWSDLQASLAEASGQDLDIFFEQWLTRQDTPVLSVKDLTVETNDGKSVLSFTLVQETETPYLLQVPMTVKSISNGLSSHRIDVAEKETQVKIAVDSEPQELIFDAQYDLFRRLTQEELPPVWSRFLGDPACIVIQGSEKEADAVSPLSTLLQEKECRVALEGELKDEDLSQASLLFLDPASVLARSLFAEVKHPEKGFTLDVRANPLNPDHTAVLIATDSKEETAAAVRKLSHYGKYSFLHFANGRLQEKKILETVMGQHIYLLPPSRGVLLRETLGYEEILADLKSSRVIYAGEKHDSYSDHRLQFNLIRDLYQQDANLAIGMEMFTMASQPAIDRYLAGETDERTFLKESHYFNIWGFDYLYFQDILNFARDRGIPVIGLNLEKDTVSMVFKNGGVSALEEGVRSGLPADRDLDIPGYREKIGQAFGAHGPHAQKMGNIGNFLQAQALWDETMAENIVAFLEKNPAHRLVVLAGRGHCDKNTAIPPRVARRIDVRQTVIFNSDGNPVSPEEGDFLMFSPSFELPAPVRLGVLLQEENARVSITGLSPHGAAQVAGIKKGDILLSFDDEKISSVEDIKIALFYKDKKDKLRVRLQRPHRWWPDERLELELTL